MQEQRGNGRRGGEGRRTERRRWGGVERERQEEEEGEREGKGEGKKEEEKKKSEGEIPLA